MEVIGFPNSPLLPNMISLFLVFSVACVASLLTFVGIYLLWLRGVLRRLLEVQALLRNVSSKLQNSETGPWPHGRGENSLSAPRLQMSVEGKSVAILEINGHDVVRFQENLSDQQKKRIIEYLKVEGFISSPRVN